MVIILHSYQGGEGPKMITVLHFEGGVPPNTVDYIGGGGSEKNPKFIT